MTDIEYEMLAILKDSECNNGKVTYLTVMNALTKAGMSKQSIMRTVQSFIENGIIECQSKSRLTTFDTLILTKQGEKAYKKEHERRYPETISRSKRIIKRFFNKVLTNVENDLAKEVSMFITKICFPLITGIIGFIIGRLS